MHKKEALFMYRLKYLRESELLTQKQVAEKIGCGHRAYSYYEAGDRDIPTKILIRIADLYDVSVDFILCRTENPKTNR
ncbi:MAG: helix-turn-helix domain-containing protein [Oscillospiraceae bacterium]